MQTKLNKRLGETRGTECDLLTSYNGETITYDGIGNPLSYYNGTRYGFTWTGRRLTGATIGSDVYSFTYNEDGIILGQVIVEEVSDMLDGVFEDNTETTTTDSNEEKKGKKPSRPWKMQEEVKKIKIWLRKHNWSTEIKIFD